MEPQEGGAASSHVPLGVQRHSNANPAQKRSRLETDGRDLQQSGVDVGQLDFQNSNSSPALSLLPATSGVEHNFTEYSLFQQSDTEFVALRGYPDVSMASEKFQLPPQDCTTLSSERGSLSQHPLETRAAEDETFFLSEDVPAQHLLKLLQREVGMRSSSSSASETSVKNAASSIPEVYNLSAEQSAGRREGPPGDAGCLQQQAGNVTVGYRSTSPDDSSRELHRKLLSEAERLGGHEAGSKSKATPSGQFFTPTFKDPSEGKRSVVGANMAAAAPWTGAFSAGVEAAHREQDLWASGNQTGMEGSYLGFLPQSQSTPGVFMAPPKSSVKIKLGRLSAIESDKENSYQSSSGAAIQLAKTRSGEDALQTSAEVQSLPSLNYMQKVDAWRAGHGSEISPLFGPEKKALEAASILTAPSRSSQQSPVSADVARSSSTPPSGSSSSRRGEAVGGAPSNKDNRRPAAEPSALPFGRSQSPSSFDTVVMSVLKEKTESQDDTRLRSGSTVQHPAVTSLSRFSDVSLDQDLTLSSSQDSYSGVKAGASSVVSLELDNYAPYWTLKPSTPPPLPKLRELNIDERIPLYLRNLGIDQSPSTILTPFSPKGPIREPEFSPTDLCTIKGSTGTPTKSAQPSEGGSPHKEEFSRSSILSVDSSVSVPFSLDSLGPVGSIPERVRGDNGAMGSQPDETARSSRQQDSRRDVSKQDSEVPATCRERNSEPRLQSGGSVDRGAEASFVSTNALSEIRTLVSHAENMISAGSSDDDLFLSPQMRTSRLRDAALPSTSAAGAPGARLPPTWARSSSDAALSSESPRQRSVGRESTSSPWQPDHPSTQLPPTTPAAVAFKLAEDVSADGAAVLAGSARRTEPEGCSAVPPDQVPAQPSSPSSQQLPPDGGGPEEDPAQSRPSSPVLEDADQGGGSDADQGGGSDGDQGGGSDGDQGGGSDADQGGGSDGSSESSLAERVAKLLQNESPATAASSTPSMTDPEESKAREWIKLKISGQQCEPLELDVEDRRRIEEIKKELLLRNPIKSLGSTDTESSAASSVKNLDNNPVEGVSPPSDAKRQRGVHTNQSDSSVQTQEAAHPDLEARVFEIAAREGVTLLAKRSLPSPAPAPLHLSELSSGADRPTNTQKEEEEDGVSFPQRPIRELPSGPGEGFQTKPSHAAPKTQRRQDTVGGHSEEPPPPPPSPSPPRGSDTEDKTIKHAGSPSFRLPESLSVPTSSVPGADLRSDRSAGPSAVVSLPRTDHDAVVSLPRTGHDAVVSLPRTDHDAVVSLPRTGHDAVVSLPRTGHDAVVSLPRTGHVSQLRLATDPPPLRDSSSPPSSLDEGVGSSSPPEWFDTREPERHRGPERSGSSAMFRSLLRRGMTAGASQSFRQHQTRVFTAETPVPVLLPYKPRGSEDLFYIPQTDVVSSTELSDTTMESSHPGSDDAVPPRFSSEVLGHRDPGLDRGVTLRHTEGIYSKRLKTAAVRMQEPADRTVRSSTSASQTPKTSSPASAAFTRAPSLSEQELRMRDRGTSPVRFPDYKPGGPDQGGAGLDQLWQKFCHRWSVERSHPASESDASLLERLERLSRLIHSSTTTNMSDVLEDDHPELMLGQIQRTKERKEGHRAADGSERVSEAERKLRDRRTEAAVRMKLQAMRTGEDSPSSSVSRHSSVLSPTDESENLSTTSSSVSTVDTARLVRAFGAHKVRHLTRSSGLGKLYNTINKQKDGRERRRGRNKDPRHIITPSETPGAEESVVPDSASTTSSCTLTSPHGPYGSPTAKKVNRSIQTGDFEIVGNGTRRHTRDVGTTFPSPGEARASSSSAGRGQKSQGVQKQRKNKKSPSKSYPDGVSWFISADDLRSEARKENRPMDSDAWRPSMVWFEPYSRVSPWREPFRQRQAHEDGGKTSGFKHQPEPDPDPRTKTRSSGLAWVSLQEALQMRRPEFISRSRQRMRHLALQAEERKLQAVFGRERGVLFHQPGGPTRLPRPAGTALLRRAVPRKEMIQRSKQIYENLPEVRRRREEERRKAEYQSYRLNAQLYNKRITNRVLGRRSAWQ